MILIEDRKLLDGFRRGDKKSLHRVYRHYVTDVYRFLMRGFTFSSAGKPCSFRGFHGGYEIEAAIQEIFRRAFEERARLAYNGIDPYRPYLLRIARNAVINDLKSKHPILFRFRSGGPVILEAEEEERDELAMCSAPEPSAEERMEIDEVAKLVKGFKAELAERELGVFSHRFEQGRSAQDTAEKLGLTRSKVRTTEAKLRQRFLKHMQRSGYLSHYGRLDKSSAGALTCACLLLLGGV